MTHICDFDSRKHLEIFQIGKGTEVRIRLRTFLVNFTVYLLSD